MINGKYNLADVKRVASTHYPLAPRRQAVQQAIKYLRALQTLGDRWLYARTLRRNECQQINTALQS